MMDIYGTVEMVLKERILNSAQRSDPARVHFDMKFHDGLGKFYTAKCKS